MYKTDKKKLRRNSYFIKKNSNIKIEKPLKTTPNIWTISSTLSEQTDMVSSIAKMTVYTHSTLKIVIINKVNAPKGSENSTDWVSAVQFCITCISLWPFSSVSCHRAHWTDGGVCQSLWGTIDRSCLLRGLRTGPTKPVLQWINTHWGRQRWSQHCAHPSDHFCTLSFPEFNNCA